MTFALAFGFTQTALNPELLIGLLGLGFIGIVGIAAGIRWMISGSAQPDPWEVAGYDQPPAGADETVLCHRCLIPNAPSADFCENCGAPIGTYTNYLPFPQLFSIGHTLRAGTSGEFKRTRLTIVGFVLLAIAEYTLFAPVYLYQFFRQRRGKPETNS